MGEKITGMEMGMGVGIGKLKVKVKRRGQETTDTPSERRIGIGIGIGRSELRFSLFHFLNWGFGRAWPIEYFCCCMHASLWIRLGLGPSQCQLFHWGQETTHPFIYYVFYCCTA